MISGMGIRARRVSFPCMEIMKEKGDAPEEKKPEEDQKDE